MNVRPYQAGDDDALYEICLQTTPDDPHAFTDRRLPGEVYAAPYVRFEPRLAFVVEDEHGVAGYVLGARDTRAFEETCEKHWWPDLRARYPLDAFPDDPDARYVRVLHHPHRAPADVVAVYPSHLHIDLLPRTQGRGFGRMLIARLLTALAEAGSPGVHLGVGSYNTNAIGFYRHLGFDTLRESATALTMGRSTTPLPAQPPESP